MEKRRDFNSYTIQFIECLRKSAIITSDEKQKLKPDGEKLNNYLKAATVSEPDNFIQEKPISLITNIETSSFPAVNTLNAKELAALCQEITALLGRYNLYVNLPDDLPEKQKYMLFSEIWDESYEFSAGRKTYLEFCDCQPECCPFPLDCCSCNNFNGFDDFYEDTTIVF